MTLEEALLLILSPPGIGPWTDFSDDWGKRTPVFRRKRTAGAGKRRTREESPLFPAEAGQRVDTAEGAAAAQSLAALPAAGPSAGGRTQAESSGERMSREERAIQTEELLSALERRLLLEIGAG